MAKAEAMEKVVDSIERPDCALKLLSRSSGQGDEIMREA